MEVVVVVVVVVVAAITNAVELLPLLHAEAFHHGD